MIFDLFNKFSIRAGPFQAGGAFFRTLRWHTGPTESAVRTLDIRTRPPDRTILPAPAISLSLRSAPLSCPFHPKSERAAVVSRGELV
jgi:hypothetical protein